MPQHGRRRCERFRPQRRPRLAPAAFILLAALVPAPGWAVRAESPRAWEQAIAHRDVAAVERLVGAGADVNRAAENGQTALMLAAAERNHPLMQLLLKRGAHARASNSRGGTALMYSATAGDVDAVQLLLAHGADVNARASNGWTALTLASARGFDQVAVVLLAHGADPNVPDIYEWTPLMRAVQQQRPAVVHVLLDSKRLALDAQNENGRTALHIAAAAGFEDIASMLVARGADVHVRDRAGNTPAALALAEGHVAIAKLIDGAVKK
jgi:uncharacterized protein